MLSVIAFFVTLAGLIGAGLHWFGFIGNLSVEIWLGIGVAGAVVTMMTRRTNN